MAILKCSECGNILNENDKVCSECGCPIYVHPNKKVNYNYSGTKSAPRKNINRDIEKTFASILIYGEIFKWIVGVVAVIISLMLFFNESTAMIGLIVLIVGLISSFLLSMMFKWMGYSLKCLYDIKNNTSK